MSLISELEVPGNDASVFNKLGQRLLSRESRKHGVANTPIEATHVLISHKTNVGLPELEDE